MAPDAGRAWALGPSLSARRRLATLLHGAGGGRATASPLPGDGRSVIRHLREEAERKDARDELAARIRAAEARASALAAPNALILVLDAEGRVLYCSDALADCLGVKREALRGAPLTDLRGGSGVDSLTLRRLSEAAREDAPVSSAEPLMLLVRDARRGDRRLEVDVIGAAGDARGTLFLLRDVSTRWARLRALVEREGRFRTIAEATRDMVTETSAAGRFTYVSGACQVVLGYSPDELVGTDPLTLLHEEDVGQFVGDLSRVRAPGELFRCRPHRLRRRDGTWVWVEASGVLYDRPDGETRIIGVARDISDRLGAEQARAELEARVLGAQKLESLGILAGGIAHDFNNLLTPILGNAGIIAMDLPEDSPSRSRVDAIRLAARRAAALTEQMLSYAGQGIFQVADVDVSQVIEEMSLLLETTARSSTKLVLELDPNLPRVRADASQMSQVVMNLVANGSESLPESGGELTVRTRVVEATRELLDGCMLGADREPGRYVCIEVIDTGAGLDLETRERMFDPFFTTKFTGRGLGLATVLGIVQGHRGVIALESEPAEGTRFSVLLPVVAEGLACQDAASASRRGGRGDLAGQRVLVVDDDAGALDWTALVLERAGVHVAAVSSGREALAWLEAEPMPIGAAVLDWLMPDMNGTEVFHALRVVQPQLPVIFVSGYAQAPVIGDLVPRDAVTFLHKPCTASDLLAAIDELIGVDSDPG